MQEETEEGWKRYVEDTSMIPIEVKLDNAYDQGLADGCIINFALCGLLLVAIAGWLFSRHL